MALNESKGNMYEFVTHTWNTIKGKCPHNCTYCYMKRWGNLRDVRLDQREFQTNLGEDNFIFVGSSCDMFANDIPIEWTQQTLDYCRKFNNRYLFQSKNPIGMLEILDGIGAVSCATIETNRWYPEIMQNSPRPDERASAMSHLTGDKYVTIEPIMDFDLVPLVEMIKRCQPKQVNIGGDSGQSDLPEPGTEKILALVDALNKFTVVAKKRNLTRLVGTPQH